MFEYPDSLIKELIDGVYSGKYSASDLPEDLYYAIADYLKTGLYKGFGIDFSSLTQAVKEGTVKIFNETDLDLLTELRENIYMFSGAKTYQQVKEMSDALVNENGKAATFDEFKEAALGVYSQYNENWMAAEYDTAIGQGQNAVKWNEIEKNKEALPYLKYNAVEDNNECEICEPFNNLVAPVDDPIWDWAYPENHFRCRCTVDQIDKYEDNVPLTSDDEKERLTKEVGSKMDDMFKMNAGKDKVVFNDDHPYFTNVPKEDSDFAKNNFGLDIPKKDK